VKLFLFLLFISSNTFAIDFGNGSLGACTDATFAAGNGGTYQCDSVTITGAVVFNTSQPAVIILARDHIDISGTISLNGAIGNNGNATAASDILGGAAGAGGFSGGSYLGNTQADESGRKGLGSFAGLGGTGQWVGANDGAGGGGAGNGTAGNAGIAASNTAGAAGVASNSLSGGSGGGAGGAGNDGIFVYSPGSGGGGGGFLTLRAANTITVSGTLNANGGNGGNGTAAANGSGSGGGGAAGTLVLQAVNGVSLSGSINLAGGTGGNAGSPGVGGNGGVGRLSVQTSGASNINSSGLALTAGVVIERGDLFTNEFRSDIATGCGSIDLDQNSNQAATTLAAMLLIIFSLPAITKIKRQRRHR
tara:strand:- start:10267 stop:11355 length:1089 start_codon:yes stop_codon:yes gene_type:complete